MNAQPQMTPSSPAAADPALIRKRIVQLLVQFILLGVILFASAGRLDWLWAWVYLVVFMLTVLVNARLLPPELIAERAQPKENVKAWDTLLTNLSILPGLGLLVVAGLDQRFAWSAPPGLAVHLAGLIILLAGQALFTWAMLSNYYFSTKVRIQIDRGHRVATGGPYCYVRHPGYIGFIAMHLSAPLLLGSWWALVMSGLTAVIFVARAALEDRTLQDELPGYREYAAQVRYRLIPGVW
jgi:protein-S-isoprenylcysteine O-methyltransferase Ste14